MIFLTVESIFKKIVLIENIKHLQYHEEKNLNYFLKLSPILILKNEKLNNIYLSQWSVVIHSL